MNIEPIGVIHSSLTDRSNTPRYFTVSEEEGVIEVFDKYAKGLYRIDECSYIAVIFHFHKNRDFEGNFLQNSATGTGTKGVFALCTPERPNGLGMSILRLLKVEGNRLFVKNLDILNGTPVFDIKPFKMPEVFRNSSQVL